MTQKMFKVHTDTFGRLVDCIRKAMYGVSNKAFTQEMPKELLEARNGDLVFISEKEVSKNALFGPFYIVGERPPIVYKNRKNAWVNIDTNKTPSKEIAYWVDFEKRYWCLLFDKTLADRISIVWPYNWASLNLNLPPWGVVGTKAASELVKFASENEVEAKEFLKRHDVW